MPWVDATEIYASHPATEKEIAQVVEYRRRRAKPRFYTDENFPKLASDILISMGAKLLTAQVTPLQGAPRRESCRLRLEARVHTAYLRPGLIWITENFRWFTVQP